MQRVLLGALFALTLTSGASAQGWEGDQDSLPVPATAPSRQSEYSLGLMAHTPVERLKAAVVTDEFGVRVSSRIVRKGTGENLLWELRWEPGDAWGAGTWVAFRDGLGRLRELRILLLEGTSDQDFRIAQPGTWVRLVPQAKGVRLDLFLAGRLVSGGWTVPGTLLDLLQSPDAWLWDVSAEHLDWNSLLPTRRWEDEKVEALRTQIHKLLSTMPTAPTTVWWPDPKSSATGTAANGSPWGRWEFLPGTEGEASRGLGPWGVAQWVSLGVLRGWKGAYPTPESLLEPRLSLPGYSQAMVADRLADDPSLAADWIRNLGLAVETLVHPTRPARDDAADVQGLDFVQPVAGAGYLLDEAPALWHLLAVNRPGTAYLVSASIQAKGEKGASASVSFQAPAVVLPWIGPDNRLRVSVYAGPTEQTWAQWTGALPASRKGVRPDHLLVVALPLPATLALPVLPAR